MRRDEYKAARMKMGTTRMRRTRMRTRGEAKKLMRMRDNKED